MTFEATYVDVHHHEGSASRVVALWCELHGRFRRFSVDNVSDLQNAGHRFFVRDLSGAAHDIHVVGFSPHAHLHTNAGGGDRNALVDLPDWGLHGHSAGHSTRPPPAR